jgi:hypothetical protein
MFDLHESIVDTRSDDRVTMRALISLLESQMIVNSEDFK